jgi:hypothetical protein
MAAWEIGWYWLEAGETSDYWVSWEGTRQGLQFIMAEPRDDRTRLDTTSRGIVTR